MNGSASNVPSRNIGSAMTCSPDARTCIGQLVESGSGSRGVGPKAVIARDSNAQPRSVWRGDVLSRHANDGSVASSSSNCSGKRSRGRRACAQDSSASAASQGAAADHRPTRRPRLGYARLMRVSRVSLRFWAAMAAAPAAFASATSCGGGATPDARSPGEPQTDLVVGKSEGTPIEVSDFDASVVDLRSRSVSISRRTSVRRHRRRPAR